MAVRPELLELRSQKQALDAIPMDRSALCSARDARRVSMILPALAFGEYPPLLSYGFHAHTITTLERMCVASFPHSTSRSSIMGGLCQLVEALNLAKVPGELWVDGSFLTKKVDPRDIDLAFLGFLDKTKVDETNPHHVKAMQWLNSNLKSSHLCDTYVCLLKSGGPTQRKEYWHRQFSLSRGTLSKGIAVLTLGGGL